MFGMFTNRVILLARTFLSSQSGGTMLGGLQMDFYSIAS